MARARGFTLVELTTVLVLVGVLSVYAASRIVPASAFGANDFARALGAAMRLAQRNAMARTDGDTIVAIRKDGMDTHVDVSFDDGSGSAALSSTRVDHDELTIVVDVAGTPTTLADGTVLRFELGADGGIAGATLAGVAIDTDAGVAIAVAGDASIEMCVAASGYTALGACG